MPKTQVGDITMYYEIHGQGEPLLLIMGLGANADSWEPDFVARLAQEFQTVIFDNRGTGRTDKPDILYSMRMLADDAAGLLAALGIESAHVVGLSMGGMIAQELTLGHPEKVRSLVLGCTTCGGTTSVRPSPEVLALFISEEGMTPEELARRTWPAIYTPSFIETYAEWLEERLQRTLRYPTPIYATNRQLEAIRGFDACDRLAGIRAPTLVMTGALDTLVPPVNLEIIAQRISGAKLVIFENAAHRFDIEAPESAEVLLGFLRQH